MGDGGDLLSIDGQTGLGANSVSAIRNLGETAMTTREAALEAALKEARGTILHLINMRYSEAEGSDEDWVGDIDNALAARPAPQPAADTRVVTVVQLEQIAAYCSACGLSWQAEKIRAIIGNATPAPSAKIAEAAGWFGPGEFTHRYNPDPMLMGDCRVCGHTRAAHIALAGQGETP